jgi:hypothetical protein
MLKNAHIACKDTNITHDHSCDKDLDFLVDVNDIKASVPSVKVMIQTHYLPYFKDDQSKLTGLSDDLVLNMLKDWAENKKIKTN